MAEHDYVQLEDGERGTVLLRAGANVWPPPERVWLVAAVGEPQMAWVATESELPGLTHFWIDTGVDVSVTEFERTSMSQLTDEDMVTMTHVARGAAYRPVP